MAAPNFPALGSSIVPVVITLQGTIAAATIADIVKFNMPFDAWLLYATCCAQAKGGTQGTSTLTVLNAGQAVTNAMDLATPAAKTVVEGTLVAAEQDIAKDAAVTADLVISGGSAPTLSHITITLWFQRRG
jgi:hypothetical protein